MHRLGVYGVLGRSFKTTNWKNSIDIEPRLRKVVFETLKRELKIEACLRSLRRGYVYEP